MENQITYLINNGISKIFCLLNKKVNYIEKLYKIASFSILNDQFLIISKIVSKLASRILIMCHAGFKI